MTAQPKVSTLAINTVSKQYFLKHVYISSPALFKTDSTVNDDVFVLPLYSFQFVT